jgi:hypothetical protein
MVQQLLPNQLIKLDRYKTVIKFHAFNPATHGITRQWWANCHDWMEKVLLVQPEIAALMPPTWQ